MRSIVTADFQHNSYFTTWCSNKGKEARSSFFPLTNTAMKASERKETKRGIPLQWDREEKKKLFNNNNIFPFKNRANEVRKSFVKSISFHLQSYSKLLVCQKRCIYGLKTNFQGCPIDLFHGEHCHF